MKNEVVHSTVPHLPLHITGFHLAHLEAEEECPLHFHDEIELLVVKSGEKLLEVGGGEYLLRAGDVAFINSRVPHRTVNYPPCFEAGLLQFRPDIFRGGQEQSQSIRHLARFANKMADNPFHIFRAGECDGELYSYMLQLGAEQNRRGPSYEVYLQGWIYLILGHLYRCGLLCDADKLLEGPEIEKIMPALDYIDEHYAKDIPLPELAALCGISEGHFCRCFRQATGNTFVEYLNYVRTYHAEKLLARTGRSVLDISMEVGFSSVSYFNRIFRRYKNCSPNGYRKAVYLRE